MLKVTGPASAQANASGGPGQSSPGAIRLGHATGGYAGHTRPLARRLLELTSPTQKKSTPAASVRRDARHSLWLDMDVLGGISDLPS